MLQISLILVILPIEIWDYSEYYMNNMQVYCFLLANLAEIRR